MGRQKLNYFFLYFYSHLQPRDLPVFFMSMFLMLAKLVKFMLTNHLFFLWFIWIADKIHTDICPSSVLPLQDIGFMY